MKDFEHPSTEIVNEMPREAVRELLELVEPCSLEIVSSHKKGLTIHQVLDAFDSEFLLCEHLKQQAEVVFNGKRAFGRKTGDEPERSLALACAKIFLQEEGSGGIRRKIIHLLSSEQEKLNFSQNREQIRVA